MRKFNMMGFTLIEVMIVVAIIAILAAASLPSYRAHICKVERNQAKSDLTLFAQTLERFNTAHNFSYLDANQKVPTTLFPMYSPSDGSADNARFTLSVTESPAPAKSFYQLVATKVSGACTEPWVYTLNSAGIKAHQRGASSNLVIGWED